MVEHAYNPTASTGNIEAGRALQVPGQPRLHSEFKAIWAFVVSKTLSQRAKPTDQTNKKEKQKQTNKTTTTKSKPLRLKLPTPSCSPELRIRS